MQKSRFKTYFFHASSLGVAGVFALSTVAHAQLQAVSDGVSVDLSVLGGGYEAYSQPPYATAAPGANPSTLRMPSGQMPGSTFYGLGPTPNTDRLPAPRRIIAVAPATQPAATMPTTTMPETVELPSAPAAPAPEPMPAPAVTAEAPPAPPPAPEPAASPTPPPPPPPTPTVEAPPEPPKSAPAPEPTETAALPEVDAPAAPPDTGLTSLAFGAGDSKPTAAAKQTLATIGAQLLADESQRLEIRAYAGGEGVSDNRARRLSLARALAVRSQLIEQGVRSNRIDVRALGNKTDVEPLDRVDLALSSSGG